MSIAQFHMRWQRQASISWPVLLFLLVTCAITSHVEAQQLMFTSGGGPLSLIIDSAIAGNDPTDVTDSSTEIFWDADFGVGSKMTVSTSCPAQSFQLHILLTVTSWASGTLGTPQPEIPLTDGMMDTDILRDIPPNSPAREGFGTLTYRAASTVAQGNSTEKGDDYHTVTFTIVAQ